MAKIIYFLDVDFSVSSDVPKDTTTVKISTDDEGNKMINDYTLVRTLGSGSYGKVKLCMNNEGKAYVWKKEN